MSTSKMLLALSFLFAGPAHSEDSRTLATTDYIDQLVATAVTAHPSMEAARARADAAAAAVDAVRLWEDPQLGLGTTAASRAMRMDDGDIMVGLDQVLPRKGLFEAKHRRATAEQGVQEATKAQTEIELGLKIGQAVVELALLDELIRLQSENLVWLNTLVAIAQERAKNPDATASESLRLESEEALRSQGLASLKRQRTQYTTILNLLLGRESDRSFKTLSLDSRPSRYRNAIALLEKLEQNNPQLTALRNQVAGAEADADASREKRKPVISVGLETNTYSGGDFRDAMFAVRVTLPWFNRSAYRADIARAESLRDATLGDLATQERELHAQLITLVTESQNKQQLADSYTEEVIPKTEKAVETTRSAWVSSKATLAEVLEVHRTLLDLQQDQKRALAARQVADQALIAITGGNLNEKGK